MSEAQRGCAELTDVDEGTFIRFSQWAYKGSYVTADTNFTEPTSSEPAPAIEEDLPSAGTSEPIYADNKYHGYDEICAGDYTKQYYSKPHVYARSAFGRSQRGQSGNQSSKYALREAFIQLQYPLPENTDSLARPRANRGATEDYTEVFLSHARLYVFAEKYDIQPLKALSIHRLHATLALFTLHGERVGDIVALLRYSYANTAEDGSEQLRMMLMAYVGYEMDTLIQADEFIELMEERGSLLSDVLKMVGKRLS